MADAARKTISKGPGRESGAARKAAPEIGGFQQPHAEGNPELDRIMAAVDGKLDDIERLQGRRA